MGYSKKVIVLSQTEEGFSPAGKRISAICRAEKDGDTYTVYLSAVNVAAVTEGRYSLFIMDGEKRLFSFSLGKRPTSFTREFDFPCDVTEGFAAGISFIKDEIPVLVAFSRTENFIADKAEFKKAIISKCLSDLKKEKPEPDYIPQKEYDDEAVATENYYLNDDELNEKLKIIESIQNVRNENVPPDSGRKEKTEKSQADGNGDKYEKPFKNRAKYSEQSPYIDTARQELNDIFFKFPEETSLKNVIPESRWAKINYSAEKYYVVGIIKETGKEKYVCYGVPAVYSSSPPKELKGYCSFIPLSVFDMKGKGFWMMFQSAITGECVKPR